MRLRNILTVAACVALTSGAFGQRGKLSVGDPAPGLDIDTWVKGEETTIESGKVYVIEFWATWCPPCRKSIPLLTALQEQYEDAGLVIIGISDEEVGTVRPFVEKMGKRMNYIVATDRRKATDRAWSKRAGLKGIPAVFIVDRDSKVAYIGNPLAADFDSVLSRVMRGRYNPELEKQAASVIQAARRARKVKNWRMAERHFNEVIDLDARVFAEIALEKFEMLLDDMGERDKAYRFAQQDLIGNLFSNDPGALRMLAVKIATDPKFAADPDRELQDMDVALEAAEASLRVAGRDDPESLATLAMVYYHLQDVQQAIELQTQAYFIASPRHKPRYKRVLGSYQQAVDRVTTNSGTD
ncbi:MAG: redoxin domain-containing protein [Planctomycetes bacterium]|nr:redoxin domain-containing protein [Planctomycetota bacterium]